MTAFDCDFGNAGNFTEILGVTVTLTNAPASSCGSGLFQSLRRVTYIGNVSTKDNVWSQMEKMKGKNKTKEEGGENEGNDAKDGGGGEEGHIKEW